MPRIASRGLVAMLATVMGLGLLGVAPQLAAAASPNVVISQVYSGGGVTGATYQTDIIELYNRGAAPQSLAGWSLQYTGATSTSLFGAGSTTLTMLPSVALGPGQFEAHLALHPLQGGFRVDGRQRGRAFPQVP